MMKILVFGITQNPGGVESFIMNYYRKLNRSRVQFDFLCNTQTVAYEDEIASLGGKIFKITQRSQNPQKYKKDMDEFFSQNAKNYSAIWVNVCSLANIDYLKYAKKYKIKTRIIHSHNTQNMDSFLRGILHKINRLFISKYANHFFACTELAGEWFYSKKIRASKNYRLIPNAIDTEKFLFSEKARSELREQWGIENELVICQYSEVLLELSDDMPFHGDTMSNPHKFDFFMFVCHTAGSAVVKIDMAEFVLDNPRNFIKLGPGQIVSMEKVSEDFDADIIIMSKRFVEGLMVFVNGAIPIRFNVSRGMPVEHIDGESEKNITSDILS